MSFYKNILFVLSTTFLVAACQPQENKVANINKETANKYVNWEWPNLSKDESVNVDRNNFLEKNYIIVFDDSGSMSGGKIDTAKKAVDIFLRTIPSDINIALLALNKGILTGFTKDRNIVSSKIKKVVADGGTPLKSAISNSFKLLTQKGKEQLGYGQYGMIIITDGDASGGENPFNIVNYIVDNTPIEIHTIGFYIGNDHVLNQKGRTFYSTANDMDTLIKAMETAVAESDSFDTNVTFEN